MSEEIKFEPVFGPQELFSGAKNDIVAVRLNDYQCLSYGHLTQEKLDTLSVAELKAIPIVAMRRIIRTPTWTIADQKAGRLPVIGDFHRFDGLGGFFTCRFIDFKGDIWSSSEHGEMFSSCDYKATPIELPEEKAKRTEDEWVESAFDAVFIVGVHSTEDINRIKGHLRTIYRAQLSGELQAPKGE